MRDAKTKTHAPKKNRVTREKPAAYAPRASNGQSAPRSTRANKLVVETRGGESYAYYPVGKYVVAAPGVCGGQLTFKYTRLRVSFILQLLASGRSISELVESYRESNLSREAIQEAMDLARKALISSKPLARLVA